MIMILIINYINNIGSNCHIVKTKFLQKASAISWYPLLPAEIEECLFFPPNVQSTAEALSLEEKRDGNPGFVVAKWVKG